MLLDPLQMENHIGDATTNYPIAPTANWNVLSTFSPTTQREFHSYFGGSDFTSLPPDVASDDAVFPHSMESIPIDGSRSGPPMSPVMEEADPANRTKNFNTRDRELNHSAMLDTRHASFTSNSEYVFPASIGLMSPISMLPNVEMSENTYSGSDSGALDTHSSHTQRNHGPSCSTRERDRTSQTNQEALVPSLVSQSVPESASYTNNAPATEEPTISTSGEEESPGY